MEGSPRACRPEEMAELVRLANSVFRPRGGDMEAEYPLVFDPDNCEHLRVVAIDGRLVSHVGLSLRDAFIGGVALRVASVGAVCTDPGTRGRGYASALMEDAAAHARAHGAHLMLISGGRGLYHRLGYVTVGEFRRTAIADCESRIAELGTAETGTASLSDNPQSTIRNPQSAIRNPQLDLSPAQPADLGAVMALHRAEAVRFVRPEADWERMLRAGMLMNQPAELLVVRQAGAPVAYLGVQKPARNAEGRLGPARVREFGGSRWAIAEALPWVPALLGATAVDVVTHASDREWTTIGRARGWETEPVSFPGTLGILDPAGFFERLGTIIAERLGDTPLQIQASTAGARFELRSERYEVAAPGPLAALAFGGHTEEARALPPPPGALATALAKLFPMPLLWYGYNYV